MWLDGDTVVSCAGDYATYVGSTILNVLNAGASLFDVENASATWITAFVLMGFLKGPVLGIIRTIFGMISG